MSISGTMSSALSGLNVAARSAELISSNIANALTEGYGRRELQVSARRVGNAGQGAQVAGVAREINTFLTGDRRVADAMATNKSTLAQFFTRLETAFGSPENGYSLSGRITELETSLIAAAAQPASAARQGQVFDAAQKLTQTFHNISKEIQTSRSNADASIASEVTSINRSLRSIAELNRNIATLTGGGRDTSALIDQRQQLIDRISATVPLQEIQRSNGSVALFTKGGGTLLDGKPATLGFSASGLITPDMTLGSGALSGLTLNGHPVRTGDGGQMAGGSLAASFAIRDNLAPDAQANLDAMARDLISRLQDPAVDPSLSPGSAGVFTDLGAAFSPVNEIGLATRIQLNAAVDPEAGGALWRLRDGVGAAGPGPAAQSSLFSAMHSALGDQRTLASGQFSGLEQDLNTLSGNTLSALSTNRILHEAEAGFSTAHAAALRTLELGGGVDTDRELQDLLLVEQAYAANAKVIQTVDEMIQLLLGM